MHSEYIIQSLFALLETLLPQIHYLSSLYYNAPLPSPPRPAPPIRLRPDQKPHHLRRLLLPNGLQFKPHACITIQHPWQPPVPWLDHIGRPQLDQLPPHQIQLLPHAVMQLRVRRRNGRFRARSALRSQRDQPRRAGGRV